MTTTTTTTIITTTTTTTKTTTTTTETTRTKRLISIHFLLPPLPHSRFTIHDSNAFCFCCITLLSTTQNGGNKDKKYSFFVFSFFALNLISHSSVDSSTPTILPSWVRIPSTPSMLLSCRVKFVLYTKINKKRPVVSI